VLSLVLAAVALEQYLVHYYAAEMAAAPVMTCSGEAAEIQADGQCDLVATLWVAAYPFAVLQYAVETMTLALVFHL
jgi:hypothetical protein